MEESNDQQCEAGTVIGHPDSCAQRPGAPSTNKAPTVASRKERGTESAAQTPRLPRDQYCSSVAGAMQGRRRGRRVHDCWCTNLSRCPFDARMAGNNAPCRRVPGASPWSAHAQRCEDADASQAGRTGSFHERGMVVTENLDALHHGMRLVGLSECTVEAAQGLQRQNILHDGHKFFPLVFCSRRKTRSTHQHTPPAVIDVERWR